MRPIHARLIWFGIALIALFALALQSFTYLNYDLLWHLRGARILLGEGTLYQHFFDPNPPLIYLLQIPVVILADALGMSDYLLLKYAAALLAWGSLLLCWRLLRASSLAPSHQALLLIVLSLALYLLPGPFLFAQREHLCIILILPYLLLHLPSVAEAPPPPALRRIASMLAVPGFLLKPYFLILWGGITLWSYWRAKNPSLLFSRFNIVLVLCGIMYIGFSYLCFPHYFSDVLPVVSATYIAYGKFPLLLLGFCALATALIPLLLLEGLGAAARKDLIYLTWMSAIACAEFALQFKMWGYLMYPWLAIGFFAFAYGAIMQFATLPARHFANHAREGQTFLDFTLRQSVAVLLLIVMVLATVQHGLRGLHAPANPFPEKASLSFDNRLPDILLMRQKAIARNEKLWVISANESYLTLAKKHRLQWVGRYNGLWMLSAAYPDPASSRMDGRYLPDQHLAWVERFLYRTLAKDMASGEPQWILFDRSPRLTATVPPERFRDFDLHGWMLQNADLARLLRDYRKVDELNACSEKKPPIDYSCHFVLYQRME